MLNLLADGTIATELIERTASTVRVQEIVQLSLAPVFLLAAIGTMLNVMNLRLVWIVERIERIEDEAEHGLAGREKEELPALRRRQTYAQAAVTLSTGAALAICLVVAALFISAFIRPQIGTLVAGAWIVTMALLFMALLLFLLETRLATTTARERRRMSREIVRKQQDDTED